MKYYYAPMEGVTSYLFRNAHHRYFPGVDRYYMPFLSPSQDHLFTKRELREILPEHNEGVDAVPQLLTKRGEDFIWAARELAAMGYREVNLNLGCPSGTVVAKGKGAGLLGDLEALERFLDEIFSAGLEIAISVKTRLGLTDTEEFPPILELYNRYPIAELTIHPRVRQDMYKNRARVECFAQALPESRAPVCYNGDLVTAEQCRDLERRFPQVGAMMLGRGLIADPALCAKAAGGRGADKERLGAFLEEVYQGYARDFDSARNAMLRMKEIWFYLIHLFADSAGYAKKLKKTTDHRVYEQLVRDIFRDLELKPGLNGDVFQN